MQRHSFYVYACMYAYIVMHTHVYTTAMNGLSKQCRDTVSTIPSQYGIQTERCPDHANCDTCGYSGTMYVCVCMYACIYVNLYKHNVYAQTTLTVILVAIQVRCTCVCVCMYVCIYYSESIWHTNGEMPRPCQL